MGKQKTKNPSYITGWRRSGYIMALPALILVAGFMAVPFLMNLRYAFTNYNLMSDNLRFIGLDNFRNMINDRSFVLVLTNTFKLSLVYMIVINVFALMLAILLSKVATGFGNGIKTIIYFPQLLSMIVVGFLWRIMLNYKNGPVNTILIALGIPADAVPQWLGDTSLIIPSISMAVVWLVAGYYAIVYYAGVMSIPVEYYEVSTIEGATPFQELRYVTLPCLAPTVTINTVLLTIESLSVFAVPAAMTEGGGPGRYGTTFALWAYNTYFSNFQYGKAIAMSVSIGVVAILLATIEMKILQRREDNAL